jgi:hypothetical protein
MFPKETKQIEIGCYLGLRIHHRLLTESSHLNSIDHCLLASHNKNLQVASKVPHTISNLLLGKEKNLRSERERMKANGILTLCKQEHHSPLCKRFLKSRSSVSNLTHSNSHFIQMNEPNHSLVRPPSSVSENKTRKVLWVLLLAPSAREIRPESFVCQTVTTERSQERWGPGFTKCCRRASQSAIIFFGLGLFMKIS